MNPSTTVDEPNDASIDGTACGARITITPHSPPVYYKGEIVHLCAEDCRQLYTEDPLNSCLASRLLSDK